MISNNVQFIYKQKSLSVLTERWSKIFEGQRGRRSENRATFPTLEEILC